MNKTQKEVMGFLLWILALGLILLLRTGSPGFMLGIIVACFAIYVSGNAPIRLWASWATIVAIVVFTFLIASFSTAPRDPSNWLLSKIMFVAFFGIYGAEIANRVDWTKNPASILAIIGGFALIGLAFFLKFPGSADAVAIISKDACAAGSKCIGSLTDDASRTYGVGDWAEDVLFGIASTWFAAIIPKAIKKS